VGALPSFATASWFSPVILIALRVLQGLALGGEYGGAAVYVAEHVPDDKRGFYTSFIQITATLGLFVSIAVILGTQSQMSDAAFKDWGWRIPFLASLILVIISLYIRLQMKESPIFEQIKTTGMTSAAPLKEAFTVPENFKRFCWECRCSFSLAGFLTRLAVKKSLWPDCSWPALRIASRERISAFIPRCSAPRAIT
jgi:MFS family permease